MSEEGRTTVGSSDGDPMAPEPSNEAVPGKQLPASENPPAEPYKYDYIRQIVRFYLNCL